MLRKTARRDRVLALFGAGVLLLNPPIVNLFSGYVFGVPALYLYFFGVWAMVIGAIALACILAGVGAGATDSWLSARDMQLP